MSRVPMEENSNLRTHEPNLRELTAELDSLRELMKAELRGVKELEIERDRRYSERDSSRQEEMKNAVASSKEQSAISFAASKEAVTEAKKSQDSYNATHNDLVRKMERQGAETITRDAVMGLFKSAEERETALIGNLGERHARDIKTLEDRLQRVDTDIRYVRESIGARESKGVGMNQLWGYIVGAIALVAFIIDHFVK